jgi:hypothetical protein
MAIYNTEYAYRTKSNDVQDFFPTPDQAAQYLNQAEYISWKNPRIKTYDQYELVDSGSFPTGLFFAPHTAACPGGLPCPKPSFYSYRIPVWLPHTSARRGKSLEVWGDVRAAHYARGDTGQAQNVQIQFAPSGSSTFSTVKTVRISNNYGYFDVNVNFPGSGSVRLAWTYPTGDGGLSDPLAGQGFPADVTNPTIFSRVTGISLH